MRGCSGLAGVRCLSSRDPRVNRVLPVCPRVRPRACVRRVSAWARVCPLHGRGARALELVGFRAPAWLPLAACLCSTAFPVCNTQTCDSSCRREWPAARMRLWEDAEFSAVPDPGVRQGRRLQCYFTAVEVVVTAFRPPPPLFRHRSLLFV